MITKVYLAMVKLYDLLLYHIYRAIKSIGEDETPLITAIIIISFIQMINFLVLLMFIDIFIVNFLSYILESSILNIIMGILALSILLSNVFLTYRNKRYKNIFMKFKSRSEISRRRSARFTLIYSICSIILLFIVAPLRASIM